MLGNDHGPVDANFEDYMAQNLSEPELEESTKPFRVQFKPPPVAKKEDDVFNLDNVDLTKSQNFPQPEKNPSANLIDQQHRNVPKMQDFTAPPEPKVVDPNDPYNLNQYKPPP